MASPSMIVTRTPLRISFAGGGTDLPAFYEKEDGAVFSTAVDKYVYVTVKRHGDLFIERVRVNYSTTEVVGGIDEIRNHIVRESLRFLGIDPPIYVSTVSDVPASTGLGGSSAFAVGLLNALHAFRGERVPAGQLAEEACHIEIDVLGEPIGRQDQYAAAFGGLNVFTFAPTGVTVQHMKLSDATRDELFGSLMLFWTGHQRDASTVLSEQRANVPDRFRHLQLLRDQALTLRDLVGNGDFSVEALGELLDTGWRLKRELARGVTNPQIDEWYRRGVEGGALGGKLCGAGGGGCLLFVVPPDRRESVRGALSDLRDVAISNEPHGSLVLSVGP